MDRSPTFTSGARTRKPYPKWERWICDSCLDESRYMESPEKERYVAAGSFWVRQQRTGEPFYCPGHVGITPWAAFSPDASTVCTSRKPTHPDHILSVLKPSSRCSVREEEGSMPKWLTAASVAAKASQGLNNGRRPPASSAYPMVPQISSAPFPQAWRPPLLPKASYPTVQCTSPQVDRHNTSQTTPHHHISHDQQSSQAIPDFEEFKRITGICDDM